MVSPSGSWRNTFSLEREHTHQQLLCVCSVLCNCNVLISSEWSAIVWVSLIAVLCRVVSCRVMLFAPLNTMRRCAVVCFTLKVQHIWLGWWTRLAQCLGSTGLRCRWLLACSRQLGWKMEHLDLHLSPLASKDIGQYLGPIVGQAIGRWQTAQIQHSFVLLERFRDLGISCCHLCAKHRSATAIIDDDTNNLPLAHAPYT
jgi:hypothetical protein